MSNDEAQANAVIGVVASTVADATERLEQCQFSND
jgi:hypothetical protein